VDGRAQVGQDRRQRVVLALGRVQVDGVQVAVGGIVEGGAEGRSGALHQDVAQPRGHALGAEGAGAHACEQ
jgi:hypothetical protein